jgi:hypothetical protein
MNFLLLAASILALNADLEPRAYGDVYSAATTTKAAASSPTNLVGNGANDVWRSAGGVAAVAVMAMM